MRERAESGARWTASATLVTTATQLIQIIVLAQLLSTAEFGLLGLSLVVLNVSAAFVDGGLSDVIIARKITDRPTLVSLYWANMVAATLIALVVIALAMPIANFYDAEGLRGPIYWVAASALAAAPGRQFMVLLQREFRFGVLAAANSSAGIVGSAVAILAALSDQGATSFAIGFTAANLTRSLILGVAGVKIWNPLGMPRVHLVKPHLEFAAYRLGERSVNYLAADVDYLVIGKTLGPELLGAYTLAYEIVITPLKRIGPIIGTVAFPVFARISEDDAYLRRGLLAVSRVVAALAWPGLAVAAAAGPVLIPAVFGAGWEATVSLLLPLAIVAGLKLLDSPSGAIYLAKDRPDLGFKLNAAIGIWLLAIFTLAAQTGSVNLIAWCYAASGLGFLVVSRLVLQWLIGLNLGEYLQAIGPPVLIAAIAATGTGAVVTVLPSGVSETWAAAAAITVGAITALLFAARFARDLTGEVTSLIAPMLRSAGQSPANNQ